MKITQEMIAAGVEALFEFDRERATDEAGVRQIWLAMEAARPKTDEEALLLSATGINTALENARKLVLDAWFDACNGIAYGR